MTKTTHPAAIESRNRYTVGSDRSYPSLQRAADVAAATAADTNKPIVLRAQQLIDGQWRTIEAWGFLPNGRRISL